MYVWVNIPPLSICKEQLDNVQNITSHSIKHQLHKYIIFSITIMTWSKKAVWNSHEKNTSHCALCRNAEENVPVV